MISRMLTVFLLTLGLTLHAEAPVRGEVLKVLALLMDREGRTSLTPSLLDRDAYQARLRRQPADQFGVEFAIHWKASGPKDAPLKLRLEARGGQPGKPPTRTTLETPVKPKGGLFGAWTSLKVSGEEFRQFGEVNAWRATLWNGDQLVSEHKSFLWENPTRYEAPPTNGAPVTTR